jgi:hypothetical protein
MSYVEHFVPLCLFSGSEQLVGSWVCTHNLSSWDRLSTTGKGWEGSLTSPRCPPSCADLVESIRIAQHHVAWQLWCSSKRRCWHPVSLLANAVRQHIPGRGTLAASNLQVSRNASLAGRSNSRLVRRMASTFCRCPKPKNVAASCRLIVLQVAFKASRAARGSVRAQASAKSGIRTKRGIQMILRAHFRALQLRALQAEHSQK